MIVLGYRQGVSRPPQALRLPRVLHPGCDALDGEPERPFGRFRALLPVEEPDLEQVEGIDLRVPGLEALLQPVLVEEPLPAGNTSDELATRLVLRADVLEEAVRSAASARSAYRDARGSSVLASAIAALSTVDLEKGNSRYISWRVPTSPPSSR